MGNLRAAWRIGSLGLTLTYIAARYCIGRLRGPYTLTRSALGMQHGARLALRAMGIRLVVSGPLPPGGLVVANHISYLDILVLFAATPCFFVAKLEIAAWPLFGVVARIGGTIFIDRSSRASADTVTEQMGQRMAMSVPVLFFPEGTTGDGSALLRFRPRLFDPAVAAGAPVTAASLHYTLADDRPERDVSWTGDDSFLPLLWKAFGMKSIKAEVHFGEAHVYADRIAASDATYAEITAMRAVQTRPEVARLPS